MLNCIKMDLYRMFRMKSFYILGIVLAAATIFTTSMSLLDYHLMNQEYEKNSQVIQEESSPKEEPVNLGMDVTIPTRPGEEVNVYDLVYANLRGKFVALFMVIFAVLFSTADMSSGYIKNIGGQMKNRGNLVWSKAIVLFFYTVLTMLFYLAVQTAVQAVCFHGLYMGNLKDLAVYTATQTILHYALLLICMAVSIIIRNNVFSMTFGILFCMNVLVIFYSAVDKVVAKLGIKDFNLIQYTVTGRMALLDMTPSGGDCAKALITAVFFGLAVTILSGLLFRKRDI